MIWGRDVTPESCIKKCKGKGYMYASIRESGNFPTVSLVICKERDVVNISCKKLFYSIFLIAFVIINLSGLILLVVQRDVQIIWELTWKNFIFVAQKLTIMCHPFIVLMVFFKIFLCFQSYNFFSFGE